MEGRDSSCVEIIGFLGTLSATELQHLEINGMPLIHELVRRQDPELLLQALRRHAGVNCFDSQQRTPLHLAVLDEHGATNGTSGPATRGRKRVPRMSIDDEGFQGMQTHCWLVEMLLNFGANPNLQDSAGDTPLHLALRSGNLSTALVLVQNSAELQVENLTGEKCLALGSEEDQTVLMETADTRLDRLHRLLDSAESGDARKTDQLLQSGMLSNACDEDGMTALHFCVRQNHVDVVDVLMNSRADPLRAHAGGQTPFHFVCEDVAPGDLHARLKIVKKFIAACKQDLDFQDQDGNTPMHIACTHNLMEAVALLTDAGASHTVLNHAGLTPYLCLKEDFTEAALETARASIHQLESGLPPKPSQPEVESTVQKLQGYGITEAEARKAIEDCGTADLKVCFAHLNTGSAVQVERKKSLPGLPKLQRKKSATKVPPAKKKKISDDSNSDDDSTYSGSEDGEVYLYSSGDEEDDMEESDDMELESGSTAKWISIKADSILSERQALIDEVCDVTMLSPCDAAEMLQHQKWNKDSCLQAWFASGDQALEAIGVLRTTTKHPTLTADTACMIYASEHCLAYLDEPPSSVQDNYTSLACGHSMCNHCWKGLLESKIESNEIYPLRCALCTVPSSQQAAAKVLVPGCVIPADVVQQLVAPESFKRYLYLLGKAYVEANSCIKWCSFPDCDYVVNGSFMTHKFGDQPTVTCGAGHDFCFDCGREPHNPATCQMVHDWEVRNADQGGDETMIWVQLHSAPCPKCGIAIQKNQGCNHMTCRAPVGCGFDFCWVCKEKWGTCDYYSCNKFKKGEVKPDDNATDAKLKEKSNMLEKYLFYWKRYKAQDLTDKFQAELEEKLKGTIESIRAESTDPTALSLCEKINDGLAQLLRCRMALKWSFVRAFCLGDKTDQEIIQKDLFEQWLGQLAGVCDRLMMELEKPPEQMSLAVLSDQLAIAKKNFDNLDVNLF